MTESQTAGQATPSPATTMPLRARFVSCLTHHPVSGTQLPCLFQCFEAETVRRWQREGLPRDVHLAEHFGFDQIELAPVNLGPIPGGELADAEDALEWRIGTDREHTDETSAQASRVKDTFPLADEVNWPELQRRLNPESPARYPRFWDDYVASKRDRDYPLGLAITGPFTWLRDWLGIHAFANAFDARRDWLRDVVDFTTDFTIRAATRAVRDLQPDFAIVRERGAYRVSSVALPYDMGLFLKPAYRSLAEFLTGAGVQVRLVDAVGNCSTMLQFWVDSGLNSVYFAEAAAGMDARFLRLKYGPDLAIIGNVDTGRLIAGHREIREELQSKVPVLCDEGGFIPTPDRPVPSEVSLENYEFYLEQLRLVMA
jgi:uroporphyrinogen decarboxylase